MAKRVKMRCYICNSPPLKEEKISLHMFPKRDGSNEVIFEKWLHILNLTRKDEVKNLRICSKHFVASDFKIIPGGRLKTSAVPSVNIPKPLPIQDHFAHHPPVTLESNAAETQADDSSNSSYAEMIHIGCEVIIPTEIAEPQESSGAERISLGWQTIPEKDPLSLDEDIVTFFRHAKAHQIRSNFLLTGEKASSSKSVDRNPFAPQRIPKKQYVVFNQHNSKFNASQTRPKMPNRRRFSKDRFTSNLTRCRARRTIGFFKTTNSITSAKLRLLKITNRGLVTRILFLKRELARFRKRVEDNTLEELTDSYSLASLRLDLRYERLPAYWAFTTVSEAILLLYLGDKRNKCEKAPVITRTISIKADMSVEVRVKGKVSSLLNIGKITSKADVFSAMNAVAQLPLCAGSDDGSCHGDGFLLPGSYKQKCPACANVRNSHYNKSSVAVSGLNTKRSIKITFAGSQDQNRRSQIVARSCKWFPTRMRQADCEP